MSSPLEWLTLVLVVVTSFYAWQTRQTVKEMREARLAPYLVPVFQYDEQPGVRSGGVYVENIGGGAALDIEATLSLEPNGMRTQWRAAILRSGQRRVWSPTMEGGPGRERHPVFPDANPGRTHVRLVGRCRDIAGTVRKFDTTVPLRDDWQVTLDLALAEGERGAAQPTTRGR
jgi:hypothetical protein